MNKMNKIDQPIQFEKPKRLKNDLLKIQHHYKQLEEYITAFDAHIEDRRKQFAERIKQRQLTVRELSEDAVRRARGHEKPPWWPISSESDESDSDQPDHQGRPDNDKSEPGGSAPIAQKRRRKAPYRFNIVSTEGAFYQF